MDGLRLLDRDPGQPGDPTILDEALRRAGLRRGGPRIRCPRCRWRPRRHDRWVCGPGCRHAWNTFETGGRCPACGRQWTDTACLACGRWSPHLDWYAPPEAGGESA